MLTKILYFLPSAMCMYWVVAFLLKKRTKRQNVLLNCMFLFVPYLVTYAFFCMPGTDMRMECYMERIGLPVAFLLLGMLMIYINMHMKWRLPNTMHLALLIPGIVCAVVLNLLYYIIGMDDAVKFELWLQKDLPVPPEYQSRLYDAFEFFDVILLLYVSGLFLFLLIAECMFVLHEGHYRMGNFTRFLFLGKQANPTNIIAMFCIFLLCCFLPMTIMRPNYMQQHQGFCIFIVVMITVLIHVMAMSEYRSDIHEFTLKNILNPTGYYERMLREREETERLQRATTDQVRDEQERSYRERRQQDLLREFRRLMEDEKRYLDADINIIVIANELNIGRTTLSGLINQAYGKNFRAVINGYRIEFAKEYILSHPLLSQEKMAFACGFNDASAFSHKFREIVGVTPLAWAKSQEKTNEPS